MRRREGGRRVGLVPWGTPLDVFLDPLGRTLDDFCERMTGGWLFGYAVALSSQGWAPRLVVSSCGVSARTERVHLPTGTPVTVLPWRGPMPPVPRAGVRGDVQAYRQALAPGLLAELGRCDAVIVQEYEEPRADLLAAWGLVRGVPVLASFQGGMPPWYRAPAQRVLRGPACRRLAAFLVGSRDEAARLVEQRGVDPARVHRVVNPVDTSAWRPRDRAAARARLGLAQNAQVVAWHGRVEVRVKGLDVLVEAWARLCAARPYADLRLVLVGSGPDKAVLHELLARSSVRGVTWLESYAGPEEVRERLAACDVWVSPSRREGFAVAPLEAMASGRPVVLTDVPGARELADDAAGGRAGVTVVPPESAAELEAAVQALLDSAHGAASGGAAARARVERDFSLTAVGAQLSVALVGAGLRPTTASRPVAG